MANDVSRLYLEARWGRCPAEALTTAERHRLVTELVSYGWPDERIAAHTRMTAYTTARIRNALGLPANHNHDNGRAAA